MTDLITVHVHLFASLYRNPGDSHQILKLQARTSVRDIVKRLELPEMEIHLAFVNGRVASLDRILQDGDRLALFPPIGGG